MKQILVICALFYGVEGLNLQKSTPKVPDTFCPDGELTQLDDSSNIQLYDDEFQDSDKPCKKALEITEKEMDIQIDYFSRKFDRKNLKNAMMIYNKLIEKGAHPRVAVHTWELYDAAWSFPSVRRYGDVQQHMDELQHFQDDLNMNFTNGQNQANYIDTCDKIRQFFIEKYTNGGGFIDPADFDPEKESEKTWANVELKMPEDLE